MKQKNEKGKKFAGYELSFLFFCGSLLATVLGLVFAYGVISYKYELFPIPQAKYTVSQVRQLLWPDNRRVFESAAKYEDVIAAPYPDRLAPGLLMIAGIREGRDTFVRIIDRSGNILQEWNPIWSEVWPAGTGNFSSIFRPTGDSHHLHGFEILPDASLVANFEYLSTFRMDVCGNVQWKIDNSGHHSVFYTDQGDLWVVALRYIPEGSDTGYQNHRAPLRSFSVQKISETGEIIREIKMIDLLERNDLLGLLFLSTQDTAETMVTGDTLHLNDIDVFPTGQSSEIFDPGDMLVSLRNINTILVFDPDTLEVKFVYTGKLLRQHDPDFMPGDRISVLDNRNLSPSRGPIPRASRVLEIDARTGTVRVALDGNTEDGFFTDIMGVHQRLENGNVLVASTRQGRVLEYLPDGQLAWRFSNRISPGRNGAVFMAKILPTYMDEAFFAARKTQCE